LVAVRNAGPPSSAEVRSWSIGLARTVSCPLRPASSNL
jgi:hypothetical protein